ncbi:hypothetical protein [Aeromonas caviae]
MQKIKFLNDDSKSSLKPISFRLGSFWEYFHSKQYKLNSHGFSDYIFYSMPPFRNFLLFIKYKGKVILDIRDGWSISQATGYGGNVRSKPLKAWFTRKIERFIIRRSFITITCTPGLRDYLEDVSGRQIILIPNGISDERMKIIEKVKGKKPIRQKSTQLVFVCAGQFSEYGVDKVKKLLSVIVARYGSVKTKIKLIGSCEESNRWVVDYYEKISGGLGHVIFLPRMSEVQLYENMVDADYGLTIIRDPNYDFGTKIYDCIALELPVVNYFDKPNNFTNYFDACFDVGFYHTDKKPEIRRSVLMEEGLKDVKF